MPCSAEVKEVDTVPLVLVIDDEANIRDLVDTYLKSAGFKTLTAADGVSGLEAFKASRPDLVVLDIMLPMMSGPEVLSAIREVSMVPVIMLTARESDLDKVSLLEAGADDYVTKPFSPPELVARVRALLRRSGVGETGRSAATPIKLDSLSIDPATREVKADGASVALTVREFDILYELASQPGIVLSREQLLERVIGEAGYAEARGIDVHIRHLREKLGDSAEEPHYIETVRGVGYRAMKRGT